MQTEQTEQTDPIVELKQRGEGYSGSAVRFDVEGTLVDLGVGETQAVLSLSRDALQRMSNNEADASALFLSGELKIDGDINAAIAIGAVLTPSEPPPTAVEEAGTVNDNIAYLDNVGLIVLDLHDTCERYTALGFNLAERGTHFYENPPGTFTPWGTANHCVNFRDGGLLEFIAHYYPEYPAGLYGQQLAALGNHWGKITLHCLSADAEVARLKRQGQATQNPATLYRYTDGEEFSPAPQRSKRTVLFSYPTSFTDGFMMVGAEHTLGEFPIDEAHFQHPNGAQRMAFALIATNALSDTVSHYEAATSIASEPHSEGRQIPLGRNTRLLFTAMEQLPASLRAQVRGRDIACVGAGFEVADLAATRAWFASNAVDTEATPWGLATPEPVPGSGALFFMQAP